MAPSTTWSTSLQRLRRLQKLCSDVDCEAMVFVLGLDGRNNWGSAATFKWLLGTSSHYPSAARNAADLGWEEQGREGGREEGKEGGMDCMCV